MNPATILLLLAASFGQMDDEFYQNFRGGQSIHPALTRFGPDAERAMNQNSDGLLVTLPAARADTRAVGLSPQFHISGDFEITVSYEIVSADTPSSGGGAGVGVWGRIGSATMALAHLKRTDGKNAFVARAPGGAEARATAAKRGRLRVVRTGSDLSFLAAEGDGERFEELHHASAPTDDVSVTRISASTSDAACNLIVKFVDLRVRAADLPMATARDGKGGFWTWLVVCSLTVAATGTGGFLLWRRRRF